MLSLDPSELVEGSKDRVVGEGTRWRGFNCLMKWNSNATSSCRISTSTSILQSALGEIKEYPPTSLNSVYYIHLERKSSIYDSNISHHQYRTILVLSNFHNPSNLQKLPFRLAVRM